MTTTWTTAASVPKKSNVHVHNDESVPFRGDILELFQVDGPLYHLHWHLVDFHFGRNNESDNSVNIDIDDEDEGEETSKDGRFSISLN